jgi:PHP family Zn ribbon phosphoesterase
LKCFLNIKKKIPLEKMTPMQFILMRTEERIIRVISSKIIKKILEQLSLKYGFNSLEALKRVNVEELLQKVCSLPKRMNDSADVSDDVSVKKRGRPW